MASEFRFLCSSKTLVLDNFCNTPSHALPPWQENHATRPLDSLTPPTIQGAGWAGHCPGAGLCVGMRGRGTGKVTELSPPRAHGGCCLRCLGSHLWMAQQSSA